MISKVLTNQQWYKKYVQNKNDNSKITGFIDIIRGKLIAEGIINSEDLIKKSKLEKRIKYNKINIANDTALTISRLMPELMDNKKILKVSVTSINLKRKGLYIMTLGYMEMSGLSKEQSIQITKNHSLIEKINLGEYDGYDAEKIAEILINSEILTKK